MIPKKLPCPRCGRTEFQIPFNSIPYLKQDPQDGYNKLVKRRYCAICGNLYEVEVP